MILFVSVLALGLVGMWIIGTIRNKRYDIEQERIAEAMRAYDRKMSKILVDVQAGSFDSFHEHYGY